MTYFKKGQNNVICDRCGFKYKSDQVRKEWTGFYVCNSCWETRQPQDFVRGVKDDQSTVVDRPEQTDNETDTSGWVTPDSVPTGTFDQSL